MLKISTDTFDFTTLDVEQTEWAYNSLDCAVTTEVFEEIQATMQEYSRGSYDFVRGMQAPALCMALRGIRIDLAKRNKWVAHFEDRVRRLEFNLDAMADAVWGGPLNAGSPKQLLDFFYGTMRLPEQFKYDKVRKERVVSTNRDSLEKLTAYFHARPIIANILRQRDLNKKIGTLLTGVDPDGKMRTSYNVAGTETGRWSSNENAFGTGTNLQNWTQELREIFIADEGWKMAYVDLEQAESRVVAYLSGDQNYILACESGDLHTTVARMVWPGLSWTGDVKRDKQIAGQKFYRDMSYRDLAKRLGHGTNYRGKPRTMAMHTHVDERLIVKFQESYFSAFPGIPAWHHQVAQELQLHGFLTTPMGRTRYFLGRRWDDDTLKEAIAFGPQSTIGEILNEGMFRVWRDYDLGSVQRLNAETMPIRLQLLAQVHDAILIQYPDNGADYEASVLQSVVDSMQFPVPVNGRKLVIPAKVEGTGWCWRKYDTEQHPVNENLNGLMSPKGQENRVREKEQNTSQLAGYYF